MVDKHGLTWGEFYLGLGGVFIALSIAVSIGVYPFLLIDAEWYLFGMAAVPFDAAGYQRPLNRRRRI